MTFTLNISFDNASLMRLFQTGSQVVVANVGANNAPEVVWLAFNPLQNNQVAWQEEYGVYASTSPIQNGTQLAYTSTMPASLGNTYVFQPNGTFSSLNQPNLHQNILILNEFPADITAGLYQSATVNGTNIPQNAITAQNVLVKSLSETTPMNKIAVWVQSRIAENTVITQTPSPMSIFSFSQVQASLNITYDAPSGHFIAI